jgi:HlyD family secretion protein
MMAELHRLWAKQRAVVVGLILAGSAGLLGGVRLSSRPPTIPTAEVKRGEFTDAVRFRGEVKALRSISISAPAEVGELQIVKIAADGSQVKKGDAIVEFDGTKTAQDLAQFKSALKSAQAEIDEARAQARLTEEQDLTAVMKARFDVETAKLDVSKQEIVSKIEAEEAKLKLANAEQKLREAEQKQRSDRTVSRAAIQSKIQASQKALYDVQRAEHALGRMTLRAPADGTISLVQLWHPEGQAAFKPGDQAWPGAPIGELPDASMLRVSARVDETDRGRLRIGQPVTVLLDAIPDRQFTGRVEQISTIASADFTGGWPFPRNFDLEAILDQTDSRIRPGMTAQVSVIVHRFQDAITIPVQASFQKSGRTVAYVLKGSRYEERVVDVDQRSADQILVTKGLRAGERVALKDPTAKD